DIFYHIDKLQRRNFDRVVDVWGADHQGQVSRVKEALGVLGIEPSRLVVLLVQLVSVKRGQETVRMSRRAGVGISLADMLDEVRESAEALEPHRLAFFTDELAAAIHRFYKNCRVVAEDAPLTASRLLLCRAARITIANALGIMGVKAPDRM